MSYKANANIFTFIIHSGIWITLYTFRLMVKIWFKVQTGSLLRKWLHHFVRPMQTFSLLSFILESGWPCIHLDWGSKYDLRSRQKNHPVKTGNDYIIAPKYDWTTPGPGDGKIMERALFQGRCKYGNGNSKARIMERECFECCVKERCGVKFVSLRNRRKWIYCEPGCKGFCNA